MGEASTKLHRAGSLFSWVGDNIGQQHGTPIIIDLMDDNGEHINASVAAALILASRIKTSERERLLAALRRCSTSGEMHPSDMLAYQAWEQDQPSKPVGEQSSTALDVNHVTCLLHTLQWAGKKCEDAHDFEQFHALALELVPRLGATLEHAVTDLGQVRTGLFEEAHHGN